MRRMAVTFMSGMQSLLGGIAPEQERASVQTDAIRQAMLDSLPAESSHACPQLERRILLAADLQSLWYLRSDLMAVLSSLQGEFLARQSLMELSAMFEGALPKGMFSRPPPRRH